MTQACAPEIILLHGGAGGPVIYAFIVSVGKDLPETPAGHYLAIRWVYSQEALNSSLLYPYHAEHFCAVAGTFTVAVLCVPLYWQTRNTDVLCSFA